MTASLLVARARELLSSAELLLAHGDSASSVSRSYYAMFLAAEAALLSRHVTASSHRGVIAAFGEHLVQDGSFDRSHGRALARAHEKRLGADYDATTPIPREEAQALLATARDFVATVEVFLRAA